MTPDSKPHSEQLRVTEGVFELLVQEKRRRRDLEEQLETAQKALRDILALDPRLTHDGYDRDDLSRYEDEVYAIAEAASSPASDPEAEWMARRGRALESAYAAGMPRPGEEMGSAGICGKHGLYEGGPCPECNQESSRDE